MQRKYWVAFALIAMVPTAVYAAGFDPDAATQAYMDTLKGGAREKSDAYFEGGYWTSLWGTLITVTACLLLLQSGMSARFRDWAGLARKRRWLQTMLYAAPFVIAMSLITLPWTLYTDFFREKQYGLMNQNLAGWAYDELKSTSIQVVAFAIVLLVIYAVLRRFPKRWWLVAGLAVAGLTMIGSLIAPIFIMPAFNTYSEMKPGPLRDRILAMAKANDIPADHIYVFDQSKQDKRISANVSGLGPTARISLNDNLLNRTTPEETLAVVGHEMGHYVLNHVWILIAFSGLLYLILFGLVSRLAPAILARWGGAWGVQSLDDVASFPLLVALLAGLGFLLTPLIKSGGRITESQADAFGLDAARQPDGFAKVAMQLSEYRKIEPGPIEEMLFFDHPSGHTRVKMAMDWKAAHLNETTKPE